MVTRRTKKTRTSKRDKAEQKLREELWPAVPESATWSRHTSDGWTTVPRGMSHVMQIMDSLSKGKPVSTTYLALWCWARDAQIVTIRNPLELAIESGFGGQRAESTWRERMRILAELGFIDARDGVYGEFTNVLILDPFHVIKQLWADKKIQEARYQALVMRLRDVGADDLD